jgi:hypothetical protein
MNSFAFTIADDGESAWIYQQLGAIKLGYGNICCQLRSSYHFRVYVSSRQSKGEFATCGYFVCA